MSLLSCSVLLRRNKVLEPLWWAYYPPGSGNLLIIMDWRRIADLLALWLHLWGCWVGLAEAVSLAVAVQVGILEELVLRPASVEEGEVVRECVQVGQLDAIEPGCGGVQNCPYRCCRSGELYC